VRTRVAEAIKRRLQINGYGGENQHESGREQQRQHGELHFARFDLLAEIFRRATDHEPGDENGDDGEQKNGVESRSSAARRDAAHQQIDHRNEAANRHERVEGRIGRAGSGPRGRDREQGGAA